MRTTSSGTMLRTAAFYLLVSPVDGHGAMTFPRPRQAIDGALAPWSRWSYPCDDTHSGDDCKITFCEDGKNCQGSCPVSSHGAKDALNASNGQACYWFSNGCTVGCERCDGTHNHYGHGDQTFLWRGMSRATLQARNLTVPNPWNPPRGEMLLNRTTAHTLHIAPNCETPSEPPTLCDPSLRTSNSQSLCGGKDDIYYYSPWRRPGAAPVIDACGSAGGRLVGQGTGGAGAQFQNTSVARQGDLGSSLPHGPPSATWQAGAVVEVGWTVMANHGGGYAYRLAPANQPLTEAAFRQLPLPFASLTSTLRWDGDTSTQLVFNASRTSTGTTPPGSSWARNPIPSGLWSREGPQFDPLCHESQACADYFTTGKGEQGVCKCSGFSNGGPLLPNLEIVDSLQLPSSLPPGDYVLQWRWDCEESDQVWASCSDVTITAP